MAKAKESPSETLTVGELVEKLKGMDADHPVVVECQSGNDPHPLIGVFAAKEDRVDDRRYVGHALLQTAPGRSFSRIEFDKVEPDAGPEPDAPTEPPVCSSCGKPFEHEFDALEYEGRLIHAYCDAPNE